MKPTFIFVSWMVVALSLADLCCAAYAQEARAGLRETNGTSRSGLTGAGAESRSTATTPGRADGQSNQLLEGERHPLYRLRPSDVVDISFTVAPEFNQTLTIQPDGYVTLKDAGAVYAQGLYVEQFRQAVQKAYSGYLHDPEVAISLKEFDHPSFIVGGQVGRPGKYELRSDTTVIEAVQIAGGFTQQSKHSQVVLFRRVNDELVEAKLLDLKKMLNGKNLKEDPHLRPGDMVFVPQNTISKIARYLAKPSLGAYMNSTSF